MPILRKSICIINKKKSVSSDTIISNVQALINERLDNYNISNCHWTKFINTEKDYRLFETSLNVALQTKIAYRKPLLDYAIIIYKIMFMSNARFKCTNEAINILYMFSFFNEIKLYLLPALTINFDSKKVSNAIKLLVKMELLNQTDSRYLVENSSLIQMYAKKHKLFTSVIEQMLLSLTYTYFDNDLDTHKYLNNTVFNTIWLLASEYPLMVKRHGGKKDVLGKTCLHYYARYTNKTDIMLFVLRNCPELDIDCMATKEIVPRYFKSFVKVSETDPKYGLSGATALHEASYFFNKVAYDLLLEFKADITKYDKYGNTADFWIEVFWEADLPCYCKQKKPSKDENDESILSSENENEEYKPGEDENEKLILGEDENEKYIHGGEDEKNSPIPPVVLHEKNNPIPPVVLDENVTNYTD